MKQYFCVGSCLPFETINKSQINTSTAKQTFSFSKSNRFKDPRPKQQCLSNVSCKQISYTTNEFKTKKTGATQGSSQRISIIVPNGNPSPGHYRVKTQMFHDNKYFSFGLGRENLKANNYLNTETVKYPSATRYEIQQKFKKLYKNAPAYSLKKRIFTQNQQDVSPGPARYSIFSGKNRNLEMTKYKCVSFSSSKGKRFSTGETQVPGPGSYKGLNINSSRIGAGCSKFVSSTGSKFPLSKRKSYIDDEVQRNQLLPGPGNYRTNSQFGQYDGNIYQTFDPSNFSRIGRPQTASYILNVNSTNGSRPKTSKR